MQKLNSHGAIGRPPVEEEEIATGPRMLHGIFNKIHNSVTFEASKTTKAKVAWKEKKIMKYSNPWTLWNHLCLRWKVFRHDSNHFFNRILCESSGESMVGPNHELTLIMLYSNVSDSSIEFEGETKNVTIIWTIPD